MEYKVIKQFQDLQDNDHIYNVGDLYPRQGEVNTERAEELANSENKIGVPLIEVVEEPKTISTPIDLNQTVDKLKEVITIELGEEVLNELLEAEIVDKNRKGVIEHIESLLKEGE